MEKLDDKKILRLFENQSSEIERLRVVNKDEKNRIQEIKEAIEELQNSSTDNELISEIEQDIDSLNDSVVHLQNQIDLLKGNIDPTYIGKSYSDYPAGTILKTYDKLERNLDMNSKSTLTSPKTNFTAEVGSVGKIGITIKFKQTIIASKVLLKIYLNESILYENIFDIELLNNNLVFSKEFLDVNYNTESKNNCIYFTLENQGSTNSNNVNLNYLCLEIFGPNADIISRPCPFDVVYANGKYYLTNCSDGVLKTAIINEDEITKIDDVVWQSTEQLAEECKITFSTQKYNNTYVLVDPYYCKLKPNNYYYFGTLDEEYVEVKTLSSVDGAFYNNTNPHFIVCKNGTSVTRGYIDLSKKSFSMAVGATNVEHIKVAGSKCNKIVCSGSLTIINIIITPSGEVQFRPSHTSSSYVSLGYGSDASIVLTSYKNASVHTSAVFVKRFDKIIRYDISTDYDSSEITKITEIGSYEKFFLMPNNDYFAIKNNQLFYYKIPLEHISSTTN